MNKAIIRSGAAGVAAALAFSITLETVIPRLQQIEIGKAVSAPTVQAATDTEPAQTDTVYRAEPAMATIPENSADTWESDGSRAMWHSLPYRNSHASDGGSIIRKQYQNLPGTMFFRLDGGGQVRNSTFWSNADLLEESRKLPTLDLKLDGSPMVLIYHTHTTESYMDSDADSYPAGFNFRTTEPDKNMVSVGDAITRELEAAGIGVIHAGEIHDYPQWNGSYGRSAETIKSILAENPSICIVLDIHRDAISSGTSVIAPVAQVEGKQSAQIMIISGCDKGDMNMPNYRENFHLACQIQQIAEQMFPGFTRPILFDYRKYNQDLTTGSLLIEVGSQGNSLEEAQYAGTLTGRVLAETIRRFAQ